MTPHFAARLSTNDALDRIRFRDMMGVGTFTDSVAVIKVGKNGNDVAPTWAVNSFPADLKVYMTYSCDAILLATKYRNTTIMKNLLECDMERWRTEHGQEVLENTLQL